MRYILGKYLASTDSNSDRVILQSDGYIWHLNGIAEFVVRKYADSRCDKDFNTVVDGIYFAEQTFDWGQQYIYFMVPETHPLFNAHLIEYYTLYEKPKETKKIQKFYTSVIRDMIKANKESKFKGTSL